MDAQSDVSNYYFVRQDCYSDVVFMSDSGTIIFTFECVFDISAAVFGIEAIHRTSGMVGRRLAIAHKR